MCGIVGVLSFGNLEDNKAEKVRQESMIFLATELLQLTKKRGTDATGVVNLFSDGNFLGLKMGIPSTDFIARFGEKETDYDGFLKVWRENFTKRKKAVKTFMGHCRKTSVGLANDNANNHPISVGDIVGVHNGTLTNHDQIFKMLKCERAGEVDSEAIIRLVHHLTNEGKDPFTLDVLRETCARLDGSYSCIVLNGNSPSQVATFRDSRPAEVAIIRPLGIVLLGSDSDFLKDALFRYQKMATLYPTSVKFPKLGKSDVEMKILPDDHAYVWDLSIQIDKKTEIADLYVSERIPRIDKLWASKKATSYNSRYPNQNANWQNRAGKGHGTGTADKSTKKTEVDAKPATGDKSTTSSDDDDTKKKTARVWNKALGSYESKDGIEDTKKIGAVEIEAGKSGGVTSITGEDIDEKLNKIDAEKEKKKNDILPLRVVDEGDINTLIGDPIKLITVPFPLDSEKFNAGLEPKGKVRELDFKVDPEAVKKAAEVSANLSKFENDDEVIVALDANPDTLKKAPLYALANRIVKQMFEEAFALGYTTRKKEKTEIPGVPAKKMVKRDQLFIALKETAKVLIEALNIKGSTYSVNKEFIDRALINKLNEGEAKNMSSNMLTEVFSAGDFNKSSGLRQLRHSIMILKEKSNKKD